MSATTVKTTFCPWCWRHDAPIGESGRFGTHLTGCLVTGGRGPCRDRSRCMHKRRCDGNGRYPHDHRS